ncbi:MAG: PilZ domain-containing protein [SAR324 cluster bacterium]|nr:PilZ domain-containing protein [SAR324 cluster bacterium]MCZ6646404.1 PilZ domain-containing protein [SAR324 cluster bacterium]
MNANERREHPRIEFEHSGEALIQQKLVIDLVNLSEGGMAFKSNIPLEPGSLCTMVLFNGNLSVESHICSCAKVDRKKSKYRVGVRFTKVSSQLVEEVLAMEKHFNNAGPRINTFVENGENPIAVFQFPDNLTSQDTEEMMKSVQDQLDDSVRHFVMDFSEVNEIDDDFFTQLVAIDEEIRYEGGVITMANSSSQLLCTRQVSELATIIPIYETVDKAVSSIKSNDLTQKEEG